MRAFTDLLERGLRMVASRPHHHGPLCAAIAVVLCLPAVGTRLACDDYVLALTADRSGAIQGLASDRFDLFAFAGVSPLQNAELLQQGVLLPWWSDPELQLVFWRPLSSLLHHLDQWLWPSEPRAMYWQNLLWLAGLVCVAARLYRGFAPQQRWPLLASALLAVNDANGAALSWLSNRSIVVGTLTTALALLAHRFERAKGRTLSWLAALGCAAALLSGEVGLSAFAYLFAHALVLERGGTWARIRPLLPALGVLALWAIAYAHCGAGTRASGVYLHPLRDTSAFVEAAPERLLVLVGALLGPLPSEIFFFSEAGPAGPLWWTHVAVVACWVVVGARVTIGNPESRFWALGSLLSLAPTLASFPSDRLLLPANLGAMALIAQISTSAFATARTRSWRAATVLALAAQLGLSALLTPLRAFQMQALAKSMESAFAVLDTVPDLERRHVVLLGGPSDFFVGYEQLARAWRGAPLPRQLHWFAVGPGTVRAELKGPKTLTLERSPNLNAVRPELLYRRPNVPLADGARVALGDLDAVALDVSQSGAPYRVDCELREPWFSNRYLLLVWRHDRYVPFSPESLLREPNLEAPALPELLLREMLRT